MPPSPGPIDAGRRHARAGMRCAPFTRARLGSARLCLEIAVALAAITLAACDPTPGSATSTPAASPTDVAAAPTDLATDTPTVEPTATPAATPRGRAGLPDRRLTPGATDPAVTQANIETTICRTGWSKSVRPPVAYTGTLKRRQIIEYGYRDRDPSHYQEDHLVPLSLGGAPRDPRNLWPEPLAARLADGTDVGANTKDDFEFSLYKAVCDGRVSLANAQRTMATDWVAGWEAAGRP